jgi:alpha-L-arabinofuranosidase
MNKRHNQYLTIGLALLTSCMANYSLATCTAATPTQALTITLNDPNARTISPDFFGFDTPWAEFQTSYFRNGAVKSALIDYLKPFRGALYRYPGGNYFGWENSILNTAVRQLSFTDYLGPLKPDFGVQEYLKFLNDVDGSGLYILNLLGTKKEPYNASKIQASNLALVRWVRTQPQGSRIKYWELANELDWEPLNLTAADYINRMQGTLTVAQKEFPSEKLIVAGRTNPWKFGIASETTFNNQVAKAYPFYGIALHAYYDGYAMPMMLDTIKRYAQVKNKTGQATKVFVTEHGRWPTEIPNGRWEDNWYQASGSLGAVSASDFLLMTLNIPEVATSVWHALGTTGPWQLIHRNPANDSLYPSATYWGLRTLREGFLNQTISVTPALNTSKEYLGGYSYRVSAMQGANKAFSLLGVNRSKTPMNFTFSLTNKSAFYITKINSTTFDPAGADNDAANPNKFRMLTLAPGATSVSQFNICVPAFSVFSLLAKGV